MNKLATNALEALTALNELTGEPTDAERNALSLWSGWGPIAPALERKPAKEWIPVADALETLLTADELNAARDIVDTSFYSSSAVTSAIFDLLRESGFTGGRILEPGCGSGNFMSSTPPDLDVDWTGVEIDPLAARFARASNPTATIINRPLQKVTFRSGEFDAVIGNVPFSKSTVWDPAYASASLHEYFILRAIDAVRPGGYIIVVTSRFMLDGDHGLNRIVGHADLITAVRLPSNTFEGTGVVADILVLRKHEADGTTSEAGWAPQMVTTDHYWGATSTADDLKIVTGDNSVTVSAFWKQYPEAVAGTQIATNFYRSPLRVTSDDHELDIQAAASFAATMVVPGSYSNTDTVDFADIILEDEDGRKAGSFHLVDGAVHQVENGRLVPVARSSAELKALIPLRDAALELIELESNPDHADHSIEPARTAALNLYRDYVAKYGALNRGNLVEGKIDAESGEPSLSWRRPTMGGFRRDPDYVSVLALEHFDQDTGDAEPAPILLRRVGSHPPRATSAASADEALAISLGEGTGIDLDRIMTLLGLPDHAAALAALGDSVFTDPASGQLVIAQDYLSGNVREKWALAQAEAVANPIFQRNADALASVVPDLLGPLEIRVQLGATWITVEDINRFGSEVLGGSAGVEFTPAIALWEVNRSTYGSYEARLEFGTSRMTPFDLLAAGLNSKSPVVYDEVWGPDSKTVRVRNQEETLAADEKLTAMQARFAEWVWEDAARAERLIAEYNRRFNSHVVDRKSTR